MSVHASIFVSPSKGVVYQRRTVRGESSASTQGPLLAAPVYLRMTRQGSLIAWSSYNYPTSASAGSGSTAETVSFAYGPDRQRWQQSYVGNGTNETTYYVGGLLELVVIGSADYRHYIYAGGEPVAVYSRKSTGVNTFSYLLSDHQGSVASITSSSGAQVIGESFTAFGNRRNPSTWSGPAANSDLTTIAGITRQGYTFQTALGLWMGLNHMNGRVQDAVTGRFLSADPYVPNPGSTQSYNRFSYVGNNPVSAIDPTGFLTSLAPVPKLEEVTVTGTQGPQDPGLLPGDLGGAVGGTARGIDDIETITVKGHKRQMIPCLPGVDCYVPQGNPKSTQPNQPCSSLGSLECGVCVNTYLNNTYGNFGGFIASTFNAQQVIPGLSGRSLFNTLVPSAEIGIGKFGASQLLQYGGDFIAMNTSGSAGFWAGTSIEYGGAVLPQVLAVIGAATTPFATVATSLARSACGG